ncbi:NAD(P)-dependent oxidoreductase [Rhodococcus pseudokoreensis]|nr:NAD(P)-binding domain-containing protein [Rhodococcus pseudokoreensis]
MSTAISVIGLGNMGTTLARLFLTAGYETVVWNRTAAKAAPLIERGAVAASDVTAAVRDTALSVFCIAHYGQVTELLDEVPPDTIAGKTLVNLTWGTADEARSMQKWVAERGGFYLDGAILDYPSAMGTRQGRVIYSGDRTAFSRHEHALSALARARYQGADPGLSNILACAGALFHAVAVGGFVEAAAYAGHYGVGATQLRDLVVEHGFGLYETAFTAYSQHIDAGSYDTDQASSRVFHEAGHIIHDDVRKIGQPGNLIAAFCDMVEPVMASGDGDLAVSAIYPHLQKPFSPTLPS